MPTPGNRVFSWGFFAGEAAGDMAIQLILLMGALCVWGADGNGVAVTGRYGKLARMEYTIDTGGGVYTTLARVGGGAEFSRNIPIRVDFASHLVVLHRDDLRRGTLACGDVCRDTVYFTDAVMSLSFAVTTVREETVLGLGALSSAWGAVRYYELCPEHGMIVLHLTGDTDNAHGVDEHRCGYGRAAVAAAVTCEVGANASAGCYALEEGEYGVYNRTHWTRFPEYHRVVRGSQVTNIFVAVILSLYFYWISDRRKRIGELSTRVPVIAGSLVSLLASYNVYVNFASEERLFHDLIPARGMHSHLALGLHYATVCMALLVFTLVHTEDLNRRMPLRRLHIQIFYEIALILPLTLILLGGGPQALTPLLLTFLPGVTAILCRVRDVMTVIATLNHTRQRPSWVDIGLLLTGLCASVAFVVFITISVMEPTVSHVFNVPTAARTATIMLLGVVISMSANYVYEKSLFYTYD